MAIGLERFRQITSGDRIVLDATQTGGQKAELSLGGKITAWRNGDSFTHGTATQQAGNRAFKHEFLQALIKAEGPLIAQLAARNAGLPANWDTNASAISAKKIHQVLDAAQQLRKTAMDVTNRNVTAFLANQGNPAIAASFAAAAGPGRPHADLADPALHAAISREIKRDGEYAKGILTPAKLDVIAQRAITNFYAAKEQAFQRGYPGLAQYAATNPAPTQLPHQDPRNFATRLLLQLAPTSGHPLAGEPAGFRTPAGEALKEIRGNVGLLNRTAYDLPGMNQLEQDLLTKLATLNGLETQLGTLAGADVPLTADGIALQAGLVTELRHQQGMLLAKMAALDDLRNNHPLSEKSVAYDTKLWAHAAGHIMDQAKPYLQAHPPAGGFAQARDALTNAKQALTTQYDTAYNTASVDRHVAAPTKANKQTHPAVMGKAAVMTQLRADLAAAGVPQAKIDELTGRDSLKDARRTALNNNQTWTGVQRDMVVVKDGVAQKYRSGITPGSQINPRFQRQYARNDPGGPGNPAHQGKPGVSAVEKGDHYHARNLKVSTLDRVLPNGTTEKMGTVVGHGVLDMWDIEDAEERAAANARGAHEVMEAAISTNDRVRHEALTRAANGNQTPPGPVKITHVSVNLITPTSLREVQPLKGLGNLAGKQMSDYQEKTYTEAQFAAFNASSTAGNGGTPVQFQVDDDRPGLPGAGLGQDAAIDVDVDVISFSFAINPMATGVASRSEGAKYGAGLGAVIGGIAGSVAPIAGNIAGAIVGGVVGGVVGAISPETVQDTVGGWSNVYEHNRGMMEKFVGDLGKGEFGSQGTRPGGFIGSVMDGLNNPPNAQEKALLDKMQVQANIVRDLFTSEAFKSGNGDPAKMGREILALQGLAEQALEMTNNTGMAATMSKGCKSDKDRGGVTDVELKHKLITEDMGGDVTPNARLGAEDQRIYDILASDSGQFENQRYNTGLAGSKEAGKLTERIPDAAFRAYLAGLGAFAEE